MQDQVIRPIILIHMKSADRNSENAILSITENFSTQKVQLLRNTGSPSEKRNSTTLNVACTVSYQQQHFYYVW